LGHFSHEGQEYEIPRVRIAGESSQREAIRLGLFGCIHGDEPAGFDALMRFAQTLLWSPELAKDYELFIYPLLNPVGFERKTRENGSGKDLNREFWTGSAEREVQLVEAELKAHAFDGIIALHADDTSDGIYGYARGRLIAESLLRPALCAAEPILSRNEKDIIDGFNADNGLIRDCYCGVLSAPPEQRSRPFELIFETPGLASHELQVEATLRALKSVLVSYRGFISYASDL
jgi:predicted deacylase